MNLHFITSISKNYWDGVGQYCIPTWKLPGKVTVFLEQTSGPIDWVSEIPFDVELLNVPPLKFDDDFVDRKKVLKFWGKTCAQMVALKNRGADERIIWLDADVEQIADVSPTDFNFSFDEPFAIMNSHDGQDCWETGLVIFNQQCIKLDLITKKYERAWRDDEVLDSLWKPYDAQVLGHIAQDRGYKNLCNNPCKNVDALKNSIYGNKFKHWINKENKAILQKIHNAENSNNLS